MKERSAADPRILWGFWAVAAAVIVLFAFLLRADLRSVHSLDPAEYTEPEPEAVVWQCDVTQGQGILTLQQSDAAAAETGSACAGMYGFALTGQLPAGELELCFAYRSNGHNVLIHTGQLVGGAA